MSRTYNERQSHTDNYQRKQLSRTFQHDRMRRPELTFICKLLDVDNYDHNMEDHLPPERIGYLRNHSTWSCSCRMCRSVWNQCSCDEIDYKRKTYGQNQDYKEGLEEYHIYSLDDKYLYDKTTRRSI